MSKNMKLSTKLITAFLLIGIIPFSVIGVLSLLKAMRALSNQSFNQLESIREIKKAQIHQFFREREGDMGVLVDTVGTLRKEAFEKLVAIREVKKAAVERYFQTISDQVVSFSEDKMIVDAIRQFKESFRNVRTENMLRAETFGHMKNELLSYYTGEFTSEYKGKNPGKLANTNSYFSMLDEDSIALQYYYIRDNKNPLGSKHLFDKANDISQYSKLHEKLHPILRNYLGRFGYYDIFLVDSETGDIIYSVFKELDYSTSLIDGPYAKTNFGEAFRRANTAANNDAVVLVDYAPYTPSYEAPASFIASPIFDENNKRIGVAMFQMPIDRLNAIMSERSGLGKTGETYLVGPDKLMRSDSYLDPVNHTVIASFTNPVKGKVDTDASHSALSGKTGAEVIKDYNDNPVLSAYTPVKVGDLTWALLAEIDVAEAFCPVDNEGKYFFAKYIEKYGYYDLFLMNPDGYVFYTVCKEPDYQTNMVDGKYSSSNLGKITRKVLETKQFYLADFEPYTPSNGEPAAFIAQPVVNNGKVETIVALQLSLDAINGIMKQREGMGETGETYLVGADKLMRSDSFLDPANHTVKASFANPSKGKVDTDASRDALAGNTDSRIIIDYNGNPVLSSYTPLKAGDTNWALIVEIDKAEAFAAAKTILWLVIIIAIAGVLSIVAVAILIARSISNPINNVISELTASSEQLRSASVQVSASSQQIAEGASQQAASIEETSSTMEEISSMTTKNSDNATMASQLAEECKRATEQGNKSVGDMASAMKEINESSNNIANIIKIIEGIAFQTNLLALNAAVEAARAGEHGKGFAVVAEEVRNLAQRSATAAHDITKLITDSVSKAEAGAGLVNNTREVFSGLANQVKKVSDLINEIAHASNEQSSGITQISKAIQQMDQVVQQNAANSEENASASEELSAQAENTMAQVKILHAQINGANGISDDVSDVSHKPLQKAVYIKASGRNTVEKSGTSHVKTTKPRNVIPLTVGEENSHEGF